MSNRKPYIDIAKGFAMLLVIIGHCSDAPIGLKHWLYSFHMPLFFALSGYTFRKERYATLKELLTQKFRTLIVPYFCLSVVLWLLCLIMHDKLRFEAYHIRQFAGILLGWRLTEYYFSMWFITALFFAELLLWVTLKFTGRKWMPLAAAAALSFIVGVVLLKFVQGFLWSIDLVPMALSFLLMGYICRMFFDHCDRKPIIYTIGIVAWIINGVFSFINNFSDMYSCSLGNPIYFFLSACGGIVGTITLCIIVKKCAPLEYIGKNSMVFYAFQASFALPIASKIMKLAEHIMPIAETQFLYFVAIIVIACLILSVMSIIFNKWFPFMLGKAQRK